QSFVLLADDLIDSSQHPDFSAVGGPLELGFVRANSTSVGASGYVMSAAIDNWRMVITPVPEPASLLLSLGGALLIAALRTRERCPPSGQTTAPGRFGAGGGGLRSPASLRRRNRLPRRHHQAAVGHVANAHARHHRTRLRVERKLAPTIEAVESATHDS